LSGFIGTSDFCLLQLLRIDAVFGSKLTADTGELRRSWRGSL
jgi:hypothetical protein